LARPVALADRVAIEVYPDRINLTKPKKADVTSGTKVAATRPAMSRLINHAVEGDTVVVWRIDRRGRSPIDVLNTVKSLQQAGIKVRSVSD
jgi:DNA invertase Pin-like site-specific DNA recombinase